MTQYTDVKDRSRNGGLSTDEKRVLLVTSPCHFLTHMSILVFPAVTMPIIADLGMPLEEVVKLGFLMYLSYGVGALPIGYIADRWQARKLLLIGVAAMGLGLLLTGLFPTRTVIPASLMLIGLGASVYHPVGMALISNTVRRRGYALGINGVFGNMGIAAAPLIAGVLTWLFSWQLAFVILGVSTLVVTFLLNLIPVNESPHPAHSTKPSGDGDHVKYFVILCVALIMGGLSYRGNTVLLPAYLEMNTTFFRDIIDSLAFVKTQATATLAATVLTSLVFLMGIFGQLVGGKVADRYDLRYAYLGIQAAAVPFLLAMAFTTDYLLVFCAGMYVVFSLGMQPIENSLVAVLIPARWRSTGFAIKFVLVFGVGATVVYWIGFVKTRYSVEAIYVFLAGIAFLLVLSIIALIVTSRRVRYIRN